MRVSYDGEILSGEWDVTPVVFIHTELHRARPDARVVVHNHPYAATVLSCLGVEPVISHQNACLFDGELAFVDEYGGAVESAEEGRWLAEQVGKASGVLLANHGAIVTAETIGAACYRAVTFERMCRMTLDALRAGRELRPLPIASRTELKALLNRVTGPAYWDGAVRQLIAREPDVLD
jgi:ribulose-5-phosphate 4-epimerase/fuculose-1-phosphate aldolase